MYPHDCYVLTRARRRTALAAASGYLRCPVCVGPLRLYDDRLTCCRGHSFDVARPGYVNLTAGRPGPGTGDTAEMVAARERFLGRGHYEPIAAAVRELAARHQPDAPGLVLDLAGGPGYYAAGVLDDLPDRPGVCLDLSVPALRRAARTHPRLAAVGADVWQRLPLADRSAALMLSIFGPRNAAETGRVLTPGGVLIIATPGPGHLREIRQPLGMIGIDQHKPRRLARGYRGYARCDVTRVNRTLTLDREDLVALVSMGPTARHVKRQDLAERVGRLPSATIVTADVVIQVFSQTGPLTPR